MSATCPHCGKPVPPAALGGLCPDCMLQAGLVSGTQPLAGPGGARDIPPAPKPDEIAPLFPQLEILEYLGRGGMGAVYRVRQPGLDRFAALKILACGPVADDRFAERFTREARALARLNHPNIVAVHDFGRVNRTDASPTAPLWYLLMEFVDGVNLRQLLQEGNLKPEEALGIVPRICEALQFAHEHGVVHRDIKPENILLDRDGHVKIADFGIAKILGHEAGRSNLTGDQQVIGTPHYMAPEQIERPQRVDHRADIYSLGVVFYEMLTGELPLGKFQPPSRKVQLDVRLDDVVLRALEKEPDRRYQHASEVKTEIETIASTTPSVPPKAKSAIVRICEILFGIRFTSPAAIRALNFSALGFLGFLSALAELPLLPAAAQRWCLGFSGFFGFFGLIGVAYFFERFARRKRTPSPLEPVSSAPRWISGARWTARIASLLLLAFYGTAIFVEGLPAIATQPGGVQLNFAALALMLAGFVTGWRREGLAALLIGAGWTVWQISEPTMRLNLFQTPLPVAALYGLCWWATRGRRTGAVAATIAGLAIALALGRLFCPANVFIEGRVFDESTDLPVAAAELRLPSAPRNSSDSRPNARANRDGGFRLYVGWYSASRELLVSAPGYATLTTNLGPRAPGHRRLTRDFRLRPLTLRPQPINP